MNAVVETVSEQSQGSMQSVEHRISRKQRFMMNAGSTILLLQAQTRDIVKGIVETDEDAKKRAATTARSLHLKVYAPAKQTPRRPTALKADAAPKPAPKPEVKVKVKVKAKAAA